MVTQADVIIDASIKQEACPLGLAPKAIPTLSLGDALAVCLLKPKGFTESHFAETHPHGALGRKQLLRVSDIVSKINQAPIVREDT